MQYPQIDTRMLEFERDFYRSNGHNAAADDLTEIIEVLRATPEEEWEDLPNYER